MNLHYQIMNLRVAPTELATSLYAGDTTLAYKIGHRDARHAAAELALAADAEIERLRILLDDARDSLTVVNTDYVHNLIDCINKALTPNV